MADDNPNCPQDNQRERKGTFQSALTGPLAEQRIEPIPKEAPACYIHSVLPTARAEKAGA